MPRVASPAKRIRSELDGHRRAGQSPRRRPAPSPRPASPAKLPGTAKKPATSAPSLRLFTSYLRVWSLTNLLRISIGFNKGTGLVGSTLDAGSLVNSLMLPLLIIAAGVVPQHWSVPFAAMLARALTNLAKGSMMSNSQIWATQMDAAVLVALVLHVASTRRAAWLAPLTAEDEHAIVAASARTVRWQLASFYFASGFWKVNTSFLHPDYSCASVFMVQPLEYLPDGLLFASSGFFGAVVPPVARAIALVGPVATLLIEAAVPALHALEPQRWPICARIGVTSTLIFHAIIGLTPPPSNVSTYGVTTCTRLFFVMPCAVTAAMDELCSGTRRAALLAAVMAAAAAGSLAVVAPLHSVAVSTVQGEGTDWHLGYYAALSVLFARAMLLEAAGERAGKGRVAALKEGPAYRRLMAVALLYAFGLPVLGLQEKAGCLMFSQLRLHGGSNHLLLPTSLLQRALVDAPPSNAFAGGVVRVDSTNLVWVGNTFAEHMGNRTRRLVRDVARVPTQYVWAAKATSTRRDQPPPRFMKHTLSALGLRHLLATAARQRDTFWLRYTRLHGAVGDEIWRTASDGVRYEVRAAAGEMRCVRFEGSRAKKPCDEHERALLAPPDTLSSALAYFLVPQPNPIVPGHIDEMHCVTWG